MDSSDFATQLDTLPATDLSPGDKLLAALALYEDGVAAQRLVFKRRFPNSDENELDALIQAWLRREGEDEAR